MVSLDRMLGRQLVKVHIVDSFHVRFSFIYTVDSNLDFSDKSIFESCNLAANRTSKYLEAGNICLFTKLEGDSAILRLKELESLCVG